MSDSWSTEDAETQVRLRFVREGIIIDDLAVRRYPEETIFVVAVQPDRLEQAAKVGNTLDTELAGHDFNGFGDDLQLSASMRTISS